MYYSLEILIYFPVCLTVNIDLESFESFKHRFFYEISQGKKGMLWQTLEGLFTLIIQV